MENLWYELKEFIRREVKPKSKEELIEGIQSFWKTVDAAKCTRQADSFANRNNVNYNLPNYIPVPDSRLCTCVVPFVIYHFLSR